MSQVDEVRSAADIVRIVGEYVKLRKAGANWMGLCPFHQEKTPSFSVHPVKQIFHCFGCSVGGDVFKFVMLIENLTFPEALRHIAEKVGITIRETWGGEASDANARLRAGLYKIHEVAVKFFASQLTATAEGRAAGGYLEDRGLTGEVIARFQLGYAPSDGQALARLFRSEGFEAEVIEKSGLVVPGPEGQRPYDRFRRRVIFPIASERGKVVAFGGRALGEDMPKYMNSPETPIYTKGRVLYHLHQAAAAIRKLDYAILVEGYMDCITVAASGVENVVASCGTSLTSGQTRLLGRSTHRAVVNYDPDSAGVAATERSLALLLEEGFEVKVLALAGGLDPDSFIRQKGGAAYRERLAAAPTYLDYLTERTVAQHDVSRPEGKVAAANQLLPYLARVPNPMLRAELAHRLADRLRLDNRLLAEELKRVATQGQKELAVPPERLATPAGPAEKELLRAFLASQELADEFLPELVRSGDAQGLPTEGVFKQLLALRERGEALDVTRLEESLSPEEKHLAYEAALASGDLPDRDHVRACLNALRRKRLERERDGLRSAIEAAVREKDNARLTELQKSKLQLDRDLRSLGRA
jgi:DNA primase